jgi:hypothetical protein
MESINGEINLDTPLYIVDTYLYIYIMNTMKN